MYLRMMGRDQANDERQWHDRQKKERYNHRQRIMPPAQRESGPVARHTVARQINHQAVDKNPHGKLQGLLRAAKAHLSQGPGETK